MSSLSLINPSSRSLLLPQNPTLPPSLPPSIMGCIYSKIRRQYYCCCCNPHHPSQPPSPTPPPQQQQPQPHLLLSSPTPTSTISLPSSLSLTFSSLSQPGLYPESSPGRLNQDSLSILSLSPSLHLFSVFDGHGLFGSQCATFTSKTLSLSLASHLPSLPLTPALSFSHAFHTTNSLLHSHPDIDDSMSGTTAIAVLVHNHNLIIANVGDSRAVAGVWDPNLASIVAMDLSSDQTPFRKDEYERVRACGARVLSVDQLEGLKDPEVQSWGEESDDDGDPPRLWVKDGMYPGTAFTRSVGDATAERIGVVAEPEVKEVGITEDMRFFVVASDGVFEFMSSQAVVDMVASFKDPRDACAAVVAESYKLWLEHENRTDDITIIVVHIKDMNNDPVSTDGVSQINSKPSVVTSQKARGERNTFQCAGTRTHLRRDSVSELQTCCDFSMELGPACVAPSPGHSYKM